MISHHLGGIRFPFLRFSVFLSHRGLRWKNTLNQIFILFMTHSFLCLNCQKSVNCLIIIAYFCSDVKHKTEREKGFCSHIHQRRAFVPDTPRSVKIRTAQEGATSESAGCHDLNPHTKNFGVEVNRSCPKGGFVLPEFATCLPL